jgi:arabinogalactan endo-1,4-beta-galactosidase
MKKIIIIVVLLLGFVISANAQKKIEFTELPKASQDFIKNILVIQL